ncbi:MAG: glycerate kinase [Thermoleophilaceae bacterium]|nr:glycerate kinase [Thermoleophilaceae bacterium]
MTADKRPVLVAPDKFKGTLAAHEVAAAVADGLNRVGIESDICRIADGGEGTLEIVVEALGGEVVECLASDALGRVVTARFALLNERIALVQSADAIGLGLIADGERDALSASSRGVGELVAAAAATGVREVLVAVGGTASTDGGAGALEYLREKRLVGKRTALRRLPKLTVLCDVRAAWEQAPMVFAPQKGADQTQVETLVARLDLLAEELPLDPRGKLMTGAGGGLAGGLWSACGAQLKGGAAFVLDQVDFPARMRASRAVITGEGSLDRQTLLGKAVGEVATRARQGGVPCHAIVGRLEMTEFDARILDFESVTEAGSANAIADAAERLVAVLAQY